MSLNVLRWRRCHAVTEVDKELPVCNLAENYLCINTSTPLIPRQRGTFTVKRPSIKLKRESDYLI